MPRLLTFESKWNPKSEYFKYTKVICPAQIGDEERRQIADTALAAFRLVGCESYGRVDMRLDADGRLRVIEVNPNPDISPGNGAARQAEATGMTYAQFIEKIVHLAFERDGQ
jgi:D-alanine-D-alanine ligase